MIYVALRSIHHTLLFAKFFLKERKSIIRKHNLNTKLKDNFKYNAKLIKFRYSQLMNENIYMKIYINIYVCIYLLLLLLYKYVNSFSSSFAWAVVERAVCLSMWLGDSDCDCDSDCDLWHGMNWGYLRT